jgi:hypothetical protein
LDLCRRKERHALTGCWIVKKLVSDECVSVDIELCWERKLVVIDFIVLVAEDVVNGGKNWQVAKEFMESGEDVKFRVECRLGDSEAEGEKSVDLFNEAEVVAVDMGEWHLVEMLAIQAEMA